MEPMKNIPVYRHSAAYAVEHGELEAYKTSRVAGVACRDAIEKAVAKHYRDNCLNKAGAREVIDEFGKERVMTVLAITIRDKLYDGRFSSANKAWAQAFPIGTYHCQIRHCSDFVCGFFFSDRWVRNIAVRSYSYIKYA